MDMLKALREQNGKYLGNRPMKISKSSWKDRDVKEVGRTERTRENIENDTSKRESDRTKGEITMSIDRRHVLLCIPTIKSGGTFIASGPEINPHLVDYTSTADFSLLS
ncbi:unnamed protein product [Laminaria digitata]